MVSDCHFAPTAGRAPAQNLPVCASLGWVALWLRTLGLDESEVATTVLFIAAVLVRENGRNMVERQHVRA
jgi:hypothetical protein